MRIDIGIALAVTALAAAPAFAQSKPASDDADPREIVVQGERISERQVERFVDALTEAPVGGQIAQFENAVCPKAVGLGPVQNAAVEARLRAVAGAAGMDVARSGCSPNVVVVAVSGKQQFITALRKNHPVMFRGMSNRKARTLAGADGPAAAWQVVGLVDPDGNPLNRGDPPNDYYTVATNGLQSRLTSTVRPHFAASFLVVELGAIAGLSTMQFADYAAMRTFVRTDPARAAKPAASTILTLLDDAAADRPLPRSLTQWDFSFLKSLYATSNAAYAHLQRGTIAHFLKKDLARAPAAKE